ncbi:MAG: hypothetical protein IPJ31_02045 [Bacteroidetes bacterium]|nr:hypothetical protein [Bacteroidota bacterium]
MKKSIFIISILCIVFSFKTYAQKKISVQSGNNTSFYATVDSAVLNAQNGDIIYIPGGSYVISSLLINKGVQIFGAGHYPDSTAATGQTILTGDVRILSGADNGSISGCNILGNVFFGTNVGDQTVNNFGISRCKMNSLHISHDGQATTNSSNIYISENVILGNVFGGNCINTLYKKNIINGLLHAHSASVFENNIMLISGGACYVYFLNSVNGCIFDNNILSFANGGCGVFFFNNSVGNIFNNNLFREVEASYFPNGTNLQFNNFFGFVASDVFNGGTGFIFSYNEDYHMLPTCVAHNGGTDGTDPGIYGTSDPYKEGAVPANPHIRTKNIAGATNAQGDLSIDIKVAAQAE